MLGTKHIILYVIIAIVIIGAVWFMMRGRANKVS